MGPNATQIGPVRQRGDAVSSVSTRGALPIPSVFHIYKSTKNKLTISYIFAFEHCV